MRYQHVVDAKAAFGSLARDTTNSAKDWRSAVDVAFIRDSLRDTTSDIRWMPHVLMPVDGLTQVDAGKTNEALAHLMKTGRLRLISESTELASRAKLKSAGRPMSRSMAASRRRFEDEAGSSELLATLPVCVHESAESTATGVAVVSSAWVFDQFIRFGSRACSHGSHACRS
jgi:hypothetical protein